MLKIARLCFLWTQCFFIS